MSTTLAPSTDPTNNIMEAEKKSVTRNERETEGGGIVKMEPKHSNGFISKIIDLVEKLVVKLLYDSPLPRHWLSDNFAPVPDETSPTKDFPVRGYLPDCLNGEFVRAGPNPKFAPVAGYHWFDGWNDSWFTHQRWKSYICSPICENFSSSTRILWRFSIYEDWRFQGSIWFANG